MERHLAWSWLASNKQNPIIYKSIPLDSVNPIHLSVGDDIFKHGYEYPSIYGDFGDGSCWKNPHITWISDMALQ